MTRSAERGLDGIFLAAKRIMLANASLFVPPLIFPWAAALWWLLVSVGAGLVAALFARGALGALAAVVLGALGTVLALLVAGGFMAGWGEMVARAAGTGRCTVWDFFLGLAQHTWRFATGMATIGLCLAGLGLLWAMGLYVAHQLPPLVFGPFAARWHLVAIAGMFWLVCGIVFVLFASMWQPAAVVDRLGGRHAVAQSFAFVRRHWPTVGAILATSLFAHGVLAAAAYVTKLPIDVIAFAATRSTTAGLAFFTGLVVLELYLIAWAALATFFKLAQFIAYIDLSAEPAPATAGVAPHSARSQSAAQAGV